MLRRWDGTPVATGGNQLNFELIVQRPEPLLAILKEEPPIESEEPPQEPQTTGRGRPRGSLNKATIACRKKEATTTAEMREKTTLDVSFKQEL